MRGPKNWEAKRAIVLHRDGYVCQICGVADATDVDHIWPRAAGGQDELDNLQAACGKCNKTKADGYNVGDATIQQLMWLQNSANDRLDKARAAAEEARSWLRYYGAPLSVSSDLRVAEATGQRVDGSSQIAETFDLLSRLTWSGSSLGWVTADQIRKCATEVRDDAEQHLATLVSECEAGERLAEEMDQAGAADLREFLK